MQAARNGVSPKLLRTFSSASFSARYLTTSNLPYEPPISRFRKNNISHILNKSNVFLGRSFKLFEALVRQIIMVENEPALNETVIKVDKDEKDDIKLDAANYKKKIWVYVIGSVLFVAMIEILKWELNYRSSKGSRTIFRIMNAEKELFDIHIKNNSHDSFSTNMAVWIVKNDQDSPKYSLITVVDPDRKNIDKIYDFIKTEKSSFKDSKLVEKYCFITGCQNYDSFGKKNTFNIQAIFKESRVHQFESLPHFMRRRNIISDGSEVDKYLLSEINRYIEDNKISFATQRHGYLAIVSPNDSEETFSIPLLDSFIKSL